MLLFANSNYQVRNCLRVGELIRIVSPHCLLHQTLIIQHNLLTALVNSQFLPDSRDPVLRACPNAFIGQLSQHPSALALASILIVSSISMPIQIIIA